MNYRLLLFFSALCLVPMNLFAWTNGELLIWMDADRGHALGLIAKNFQNDFGIKVTIETPEKITDSFPIAAQAAKGPDIVIWAHDKVGEWADAGLIAPVEVSNELKSKFFPKAWEAALHAGPVFGISDRPGDRHLDLQQKTARRPPADATIRVGVAQ
jgi:maltose/maltodextrin transport system substrate-binding protein